MIILFIGDIVGRPGRHSVARWLPELRESHEVDLVVANGENAAGGLGATPEILDELRQYGIQAFTMGNHVYRKRVLMPALDGLADVVRPANYPAGAPGRGAAVIRLADGRKVGLLNLLGRVFMEPLECPFLWADREVARLREETPVVLVDMHAEATSEKVALGWYLDGRCTAVVGTHTHVQTADEWVLPEGTAYISDVGMCGPAHSVIGVEKEAVIGKFVTGLPREFRVAGGPMMFSAVLIEADDATGRARRITRIQRKETETAA
jgi:metallophosphoesterase (TIGR00282 family)